MSQAPSGSIRLFRVVGIDVYLHWTWLAVGFYEISERTHEYSSISWNILEYLTLFAIVLLHEFGHALSCRQVGGRADTIMLWPLGGVAYVAPPPRPGATLWSISAGPLVNVALMVPLSVLALVARSHDWYDSMPDIDLFVSSLWKINTGLLIFNMLPIYPLDGGQILRSLLWFFVGPARSLFIVAIIGFAGVVGLALLAWNIQSLWLGVIAFFMFGRCRQAWTQARAIRDWETNAVPPPLEKTPGA